jgi:hypothetical protein
MYVFMCVCVCVCVCVYVCVCVCIASMYVCGRCDRMYGWFGRRGRRSGISRQEEEKQEEEVNSNNHQVNKTICKCVVATHGVAEEKQ